MAVRSADIQIAPLGMGTDYDRSLLPPSLAQEIIGFTPARRGKMELAPLLKTFQRQYGLTINGTAVWLTEAGVGDRLLIFSGTSVYSTQLYNVWKYDERIDGQHSFYQLGALGSAISHAGGNAANGVVSIQMGQELIISIGGILNRYYVTTDGLGSELMYAVGVGTPGPPTLAGGTAGGSLTPSQTYEYLITYSDELGRESSPSASASVTLTSSMNRVVVTKYAGAYLSGGGETTWSVYRRNPGSATFNLVFAGTPLGTTTYTDTSSDDTVNSGAAAPSAGENDPPVSTTGPGPVGARGAANSMCVWKDRLVINNTSYPNTKYC